MRRRVLLLRHAKSSWDDPRLDDHDRPLAPRGERALPKLRRHLGEQRHRPELVLCSSARRTVQTLAGVSDALPGSTDVEVDPGLYLAEADELLERLRELPTSIRTVMLVGHNPGLEELADLLTGEGDPELIDRLHAKFPTGALATLSFAGDWTGLDTGAARLDDLFVPRPPRESPPA